MKPSLFDYHAPDTVAEAVTQLGDIVGSVILAGGQSLVPAMNLRLANPSAVIDLRNIPNLSDIVVDNSLIKIGAMVRHRDLETNEAVYRANPFIREAERHVAHIPIRNWGTVVGSLCHADAAAEMPLVWLLCDGTVTALGPSGKREIAAADFFQFHMTTSRSEDELIVEACIPALPGGAGYSFQEFARRRGDYAIAAVGAIVSCDPGGTITKAAVGACGIGSRPLRLSGVEEQISGKQLSESILQNAAQSSRDYVTAPDDIHATNAYRRHLLSNLVRRAISTAVARATEGENG